ncbi:uncharacterized protein LOC121587294 [Coregonus clupeaformis]|uniref:uncharacterized protein LOC121587294 n=1 Tax=Coregonus clupeaformis TaxID=59861 RepID=UPI001BE006C1|nr:uncharacterized protein LOC121587294 [Coregonus clupeaformis]
MQHLMPGFDVLISQVRKTGGFYMTTFALFLYHVVFDEHLKCLCKHGVKPEVTYNHCHVYMVLPTVILFLLTLWMDGQFQRILRITCRGKCNLWGRLLAILIKAAAIGFLWVVSVLLDGDWYVCYKRAELPCKNNTDDKPYHEELEKQVESRFKRESVVIGLVLVLVLLVMNSILTAIPWRDICSILTAIPWRDICSILTAIPGRDICSILTAILCMCYRCCRIAFPCNLCNCKKNCWMTDCEMKPYHRTLFEEYICEQIEILIENDLKTTAKECVVLQIRELLQPSSTAVPSDTTTQGGGGASSSTTRPEVEDGRSSTTRPEVGDRVITLDNLDFVKIADLHSGIISSLFPATPQQPKQGEDGPRSQEVRMSLLEQ